MNSEFNKAVIAAAMSLLVIIDQLWGISIGWLSEEYVTMLLAILAPILVWLVPNAPPPVRRH